MLSALSTLDAESVCMCLVVSSDSSVHKVFSLQIVLYIIVHHNLATEPSRIPSDLEHVETLVLKCVCAVCLCAVCAFLVQFTFLLVVTSLCLTVDLDGCF